ncbi:hypothetical protein COCON_G00131980 [Conger conger]|uniref:Uncharacterized protein n=1 Tax=Conger conger TaxID=82655 RepID=A0A9Q1DEK4_CONCO|nr:hypothetical protein COCON_G00131980 [Conger conger]
MAQREKLMGGWSSTECDELKVPCIIKASNSTQPGDWTLERSVDGVEFWSGHYGAACGPECLVYYKVTPPMHTEVICTRTEAIRFYLMLRSNQSRALMIKKGVDGSTGDGFVCRLVQLGFYGDPAAGTVEGCQRSGCPLTAELSSCRGSVVGESSTARCLSCDRWRPLCQALLCGSESRSFAGASSDASRRSLAAALLSWLCLLQSPASLSCLPEGSSWPDPWANVFIIHYAHQIVCSWRGGRMREGTGEVPCGLGWAAGGGGGGVVREGDVPTPDVPWEFVQMF